MAQTKVLKKTMSATQGAYVELKRRILDGELAEGSPIRQDEVAAQLGVSKIPVREALMRLQSEGLVKFTPNVRRGRCNSHGDGLHRNARHATCA